MKSRIKEKGDWPSSQATQHLFRKFSWKLTPVLNSINKLFIIPANVTIFYPNESFIDLFFHPPRCNVNSSGLETLHAIQKTNQRWPEAPIPADINPREMNQSKRNRTTVCTKAFAHSDTSPNITNHLAPTDKLLRTQIKGLY